MLNNVYLNSESIANINITSMKEKTKNKTMVTML